MGSDGDAYLHDRLLVGVRVGIRLHVIDRLAKVLPQHVEETDQLAVCDVLDPLSKAREYTLRILARERRAVQHLEVGVPVMSLGGGSPGTTRRDLAEIGVPLMS